MENIIKGIRQYYPVSDSSLEVLFSHMEKLELPKKHLLIRGGVADRHVYFIEKGFCRSYCLHDGEEITIWFSREGDITFARIVGGLRIICHTYRRLESDL